jgi:hypothetical protein
LSTILKALQRLEDEKVVEVERSLDERIVARRSPPDSARRLGLWIGIAAIGSIAVAAAAFLLWPTQRDSDAVVALEAPPLAAAPVAAAAPAQPVAPAEPPYQPPVRSAPAAPEQAGLAEVQVVEVVQRLDAQPADSRPPATSPDRVAPAVEVQRPARPAARKPRTQVAGAPDIQVAREPDTQAAHELDIQAAREPDTQAAHELDTQAAREPDTEVANEAAQLRPAAEQVPPAIQTAEAPVEPVARDSVSVNTSTAPPAPIEIAAVAPQPAPIVASEPPAAPIRAPEQKVVQRAMVPSLSIEKTIWHPDANRRVAIVKMIESDETLRLKEGDAIGPLVVESIKPGSIVFNHDGVEISYNVGR